MSAPTFCPSLLEVVRVKNAHRVPLTSSESIWLDQLLEALEVACSVPPAEPRVGEVSAESTAALPPEVSPAAGPVEHDCS